MSKSTRPTVKTTINGPYVLACLPAPGRYSEVAGSQLLNADHVAFVSDSLYPGLWQETMSLTRP